MKKWCFIVCIFAAFSAQATAWNSVLTAKSQLSFVSQQMGVPVNGAFKKFNAQVHFDPTQLSAARIDVEVDLASIDAGSSDANDAVQGKEWLNIAVFPKARYVATVVKSLGKDRFEAQGALTIKGITRATTVQFALHDAADGAWLEGAFVLPRLQFKIGEGMWTDTDTVADAIQVKFKLLLQP